MDCGEWNGDIPIDFAEMELPGIECDLFAEHESDVRVGCECHVKGGIQDLIMASRQRP